MQNTSQKIKNNAASLLFNFQMAPDFRLLAAQNNSSENEYIQEPVGHNFIQFHFCLKNQVDFFFNEGSYSLNLGQNKALLLYNPDRNLPISLALNHDSSWISILISIEKFHGLFSDEAGFIDFLNDENRNRKYYKDFALSPALIVVLKEMINTQLHPNVQDLYLKGKVFELMALFFDYPKEADMEQCPFLKDEENVKRIRKAKTIIIENLSRPPQLKELAKMTDLSLNKLKEGFKEIYGETVFGFLFNYKMELARQLLETGQYSVSEVGLKIGYSTSSHFIAGFKKKFGITPKKYILTVDG